MPTPVFGVASRPDSAVCTSTDVATASGFGLSDSATNAAGTLNSPAPWAYAPMPGTNRAVDLMAARSCATGGRRPLCVALYALTSSAAAPVACGAAIDVPCSIAYPAGRAYVPATGPGASQRGVVEIAAPGAMMSGLKPPSSRGPREENGCSDTAFWVFEP